MTDRPLPSSAEEVLALPEDVVTAAIPALIRERRLNALVRRLNADLLAADADVRARARAALDRLGFVE